MTVSPEQADALRTEFYQRLADAKDCPACAVALMEWVQGGGFDIENLRGEDTRQLRRDADHVQGIYWRWSDLYSLHDPAGMSLCSDLRREFP